MKKKILENFNSVMLWLVTVCAVCAVFTTTHYAIETYNDNKTFTLNVAKSN